MISIIVPVYRSEETLQRCVESLTTQTYQDIEILLIIDGEADGSGAIADALAEKDSRIRVMRQENQGVSAARNRGIEEAGGDYVLFLDSDDYADPRLCEVLWLAIAEHNADIAVCGFHHLYFGRDVIKLPKEGVYLVREEKTEILSLYQTQFLNMPWNKLFRREMMSGRFRKDLDLGEDLLFNLQYLERCARVVTVAEPLIYYVQDDRGTTLSTKQRQDRAENMLYLYTQLQDFCRRLYGDDRTDGALESRLMEALLDGIEELAFAKGMRGRDKRNSIRRYYEAYLRIPYKNDICVTLPDYKIILSFWTRGSVWLTWILVELRGLVVRLLGKR